MSQNLKNGKPQPCFSFSRQGGYEAHLTVHEAHLTVHEARLMAYEAALRAMKRSLDRLHVFLPHGQKNGRSSRIRTGDFLVPNQTRYQLRYTPTAFQIPIMYHAFGKIKARHIIFSVFLSFKSHKKCTGALCFFRQDQFSAVPDHRYRSIIFVFIQQNCGNAFCFFHSGNVQFQ